MVKKTTVEATSSLNKLKWLVVIGLLAAGVATNHIYVDINISLRLIGWIILIGASLGVASLTSQGVRALAFAKEARGELRRVVWPTRPETIRTTMMVVVLILVVGVILWGVDSMLLWAVSFVTK